MTPRIELPCFHCDGRGYQHSGSSSIDVVQVACSVDVVHGSGTRSCCERREINTRPRITLGTRRPGRTNRTRRASLAVSSSRAGGASRPGRSWRTSKRAERCRRQSHDVSPSL